MKLARAAMACWLVSFAAGCGDGSQPSFETGTGTGLGPFAPSSDPGAFGRASRAGPFAPQTVPGPFALTGIRRPFAPAGDPGPFSTERTTGIVAQCRAACTRVAQLGCRVQGDCRQQCSDAFSEIPAPCQQVYSVAFSCISTWVTCTDGQADLAPCADPVLAANECLKRYEPTVQPIPQPGGRDAG